MAYNSDEKIAFIDLEFGHVHGTHKKISLPTEVGITFYDGNSNYVNYSNRIFAFDIDVERWKSITDRYGNRIGTAASVANFKKREFNKELDPKYRLNFKQKKNAYQIVGRAYTGLNQFMSDILEINHADKLIFFGDSRERFAFKKAKIDTKKYDWIDLQSEIKNEYDMEMLLSLDKVSHAIKFRNNMKHIRSLNFKYKTSSKYKYQIKPHKALGDSVRIFLAYKEFNHDKDKFKKTIGKHLDLCQANIELIRTKST